MSEIDQLRKSCQREMESNEMLTMTKQRIAREIKTCQNHIDEENRKRAELERQLAAQQTIINQLGKDLDATMDVLAR